MGRREGGGRKGRKSNAMLRRTRKSHDRPLLVWLCAMTVESEASSLVGALYLHLRQFGRLASIKVQFCGADVCNSVVCQERRGRACSDQGMPAATVKPNLHQTVSRCP